MVTVQNIYDAFERYKRDISDVELEVFTEWVQFVTRFIYDKAKKVDSERFIKTSNFVITTDPFTGTLPVDFQDLNQTSCGLYYYDTTATKATNKKLGMTGYGSTLVGYYLTGSSIIFTGIEDKTYVMRYIPVPPVIDALTDYLTVDGTALTASIVEERHVEYMVKAIDVLYGQWDNDPNGESTADFRFVRALSGLLESYNRTPQISVMPSPSNYY